MEWWRRQAVHRTKATRQQMRLRITFKTKNTAADARPVYSAMFGYESGIAITMSHSSEGTTPSSVPCTFTFHIHAYLMNTSGLIEYYPHPEKLYDRRNFW